MSLLHWVALRINPVSIPSLEVGRPAECGFLFSTKGSQGLCSVMWEMQTESGTALSSWSSLSGRHRNSCLHSPAAPILKLQLFCIHHSTIPCHPNVCIFIFLNGAIGTWRQRLPTCEAGLTVEYSASSCEFIYWLKYV